MAAQGALCEKMLCAAIPTQPSHTTMFTGQHPLTHGIVAHGGKAKLRRSSPFLPEILLEAGYATCAVDTLFRERIWFGRGYEYLIDPSVHHVFYANVTHEELNDRAIRWMKTVPNGPFFIFLHCWDTHYPYTPPERYRTAFYKGKNPTGPENHALDEWWTHPIGALARSTWLRTPEGVVTDPDYVTALYDGEIRYFDEGIATLDAALKSLGVFEDTIVIVLADHGESMTEHRIFYDHYGLYDNNIRVPFVFRWPGGHLKEGLRIPHMRQHTDIAPTLLEAAGLTIPEEMDGKSFWRQLTGQEPMSGYDKMVAVESTWQAKYCLRTERHKFIMAREQDLLGNPMKELYDLEADPREERNLVEQDPALAAAMETELESLIAARLEAADRTSDPVKDEGASMVATWKGHKK
jgi:arylsulfatase A-like enzyme